MDHMEKELEELVQEEDSDKVVVIATNGAQTPKLVNLGPSVKSRKKLLGHIVKRGRMPDFARAKN